MPYPPPVRSPRLCSIHAPSVQGNPKKCYLISEGFGITHYLGVSLTGRAFRSNLFLDKKGFPLQSLTRAAFEAYAKRQNRSPLFDGVCLGGRGSIAPFLNGAGYSDGNFEMPPENDSIIIE